jgi:sugar O-acyltransferase (sialic acid O-acetyltransferase NeuD family)
VDLYVIGAGGLAREMWYLADVLRRSSDLPYEPVGFADRDTENSELLGSPLLERYSLVSDDELLGRPGPFAVVLGLGFPGPRLAVGRRYAEREDIEAPPLIHPTASLDGPVEVEAGVAICAHVSLTGDIRLGRGALININSTVGHDTHVGAGSVVNPGANISGGVTLGEGVLVGTGATILQNVRVGAGAIVGAGSVVTKDVEPRTTVVGVPAKPRGSG